MKDTSLNKGKKFPTLSGSHIVTWSNHMSMGHRVRGQTTEDRRQRTEDSRVTRRGGRGGDFGFEIDERRTQSDQREMAERRER